jgi:hypothetical protein
MNSGKASTGLSQDKGGRKKASVEPRQTRLRPGGPVLAYLVENKAKRAADRERHCPRTGFA